MTKYLSLILTLGCLCTFVAAQESGDRANQSALSQKVDALLSDFDHTVTIRRLLQHTSGVPDFFGVLAISGVRLEDVTSTQDVLNVAFKMKDLNFVPGTARAYSNTGYVLAAEIVQRVTGVPFAEWVKEKIFDPL